MTTAQTITKLVKGAETLNKNMTKADTMSVKWCLDVIGAKLDSDNRKELRLQVALFMSESFIKKAFSLINNAVKYADSFDVVAVASMSFKDAVAYGSGLKPKKAETTETEAETTETEAETTETEAETTETIADVMTAVNLQREAVTATAKYKTLTEYDEIAGSVREMIRQAELRGLDVSAIIAQMVAVEDSLFAMIGGEVA